MDRISKSLDQIISEGEHNRKGKGNRSNSAVNHKGGPKNHNSRNDKRDSTFNNKRGLKSEMEDWRVSAHREVEAADKAFRPMKVVTIERPKVVPAPVATVFNRLGSAGFAVVFQNLKNTVIESDVRELCESIGQVLSTSFQGHGQAKATFARQEDAAECVSRFNGLTLDNQEMHVSLESAPLGITARLGGNGTKANSNPVINKPGQNLSVVEQEGSRGGLFGRALVADDSDGRTVTVTFDGQKTNQRNTLHKKAVQSTRLVETSNHGNGNNMKRERQQGNKRDSFKGRKVRSSSDDRASSGPVDMDSELALYMSKR